MYTLEEVRNIFIDIEEKYNVYYLKIDNIYFWKLIRIHLFDKLVISLNVLDVSHPFNHMDRVVRLFRLVKYAALGNVKRNHINKSNVFILTHGRKMLSDNKYIDIYMDELICQEQNQRKTVLVMDRPDHYGKHYPVTYKNVIYFERFGHLFREGIPILNAKNKIPDGVSKILTSIVCELEQHFSIKINLEKLILKKIKRFNSEKKYFETILQKSEPEIIYLAVSYGKEELIAAAQAKNIPTVEFQHGVISTYHMGYYFPFQTDVPYFPDKVVLYGDYWKDSVSFPTNCELEIQPSKWIAQKFQKKKEKKEDCVLFISQGTIGKKLSKIAADFAENCNMKCYYKLHPSEFGVWKSQYQNLEQAAAADKITVISNEYSIYELFDLCQYAIGVYSTSIYEALMFDCLTFVVKLQGYQYMEYLIEHNYIKLLETKFCDNDLKQYEHVKIPNSSYFYCR